jgi:hypothetical protein
MVLRLLTLAVFAASLGAWPAGANDLASCPVPNGADVATSLGQVPMPVQEALKKLFRDQLVDAGENFDATDVRIYGHSVRFIFAWGTGKVWAVAVEQGGIGYSTPVLIFSSDGTRATMGKRETAYPNSLCAVATRLFTDER